MRKLLVSLVAVLLFALIAVPAMAVSYDGDSEDQQVYVTVEKCLKWETCQNPIEFTITCEDYETGWVTPSNLPVGRTSLDVWSNVEWNVSLSHNGYAMGMPTDWRLVTSLDTTGPWTDITATPTDFFAAPQPATNHVQHIFNYRLYDFEYEDDWVGVDHNFQITFTVHSI